MGGGQVLCAECRGNGALGSATNQGRQRGLGHRVPDRISRTFRSCWLADGVTEDQEKSPEEEFHF